MGGVDKQFHQKFEAKRSGNQNCHNVTSAMDSVTQIEHQPARPKVGYS